MYGYIYKITCLKNNRCYVGQKRKAVFDEKYWGSSKNKEYIADLKLYGKENFKREILYWANSQEELNQKEVDFILSENALCNLGGYNLWINRQQSEWNNKTKEKHHKALLKAVKSKEWREKHKKISEARRGIKMSSEFCKKVSESLRTSEKRKKTMASIEYRENMSTIIKNSKAHQKWYKNSELRKIRYNKEVRNKISQKIKEFSKGRHWYTNGTINKFCFNCPESFYPGRSKSVCNKISMTRKEKYANIKKS